MEGGSKSDAAKRNGSKLPRGPRLGFWCNKALDRKPGSAAFDWKSRSATVRRKRRSSSVFWQCRHPALALEPAFDPLLLPIFQREFLQSLVLGNECI